VPIADGGDGNPTPQPLRNLHCLIGISAGLLQKASLLLKCGTRNFPLIGCDMHGGGPWGDGSYFMQTSRSKTTIKDTPQTSYVHAIVSSVEMYLLRLEKMGG
jgi:hypothetical protein